MSKGLENLEHVTVPAVTELHDWLQANHNRNDSIWLVTYKKAVANKYVSREEVLDELIAFGWIDGVRKAIDEVTTMQLISPRQTKPWAKSYKDRAERLIAEGRMHAAGLASMNLAKASGAWDEMNEVDLLVMPEELLMALKSRGQALAFFEAFPPSTRRNILRWISSAKTVGTRTKRINETAVAAQGNIRIASHG